MAGKHAAVLAFILMLLFITLNLVYSLYPYNTGLPVVVYSYLNESHTCVPTSVSPPRTRLPDSAQRVGHAAVKVASQQGEAPQLLELRNAHWDLVAEAITRNTQRHPHEEPASLQLTHLCCMQHQSLMGGRCLRSHTSSDPFTLEELSLAPT